MREDPELDNYSLLTWWSRWWPSPSPRRSRRAGSRVARPGPRCILSRERRRCWRHHETWTPHNGEALAFSCFPNHKQPAEACPRTLWRRSDFLSGWELERRCAIPCLSGPQPPENSLTKQLQTLSSLYAVPSPVRRSGCWPERHPPPPGTGECGQRWSGHLHCWHQTSHRTEMMAECWQIINGSWFSNILSHSPVVRSLLHRVLFLIHIVLWVLFSTAWISGGELSSRVEYLPSCVLTAWLLVSDLELSPCWMLTLWRGNIEAGGVERLIHKLDSSSNNCKGIIFIVVKLNGNPVLQH